MPVVLEAFCAVFENKMCLLRQAYLRHHARIVQQCMFALHDICHSHLGILMKWRPFALWRSSYRRRM